MRLVNTNPRQKPASATSITAGHTPSSPQLGDSSNLQGEYSEGPNHASRQRNWETMDNTSSAIPTVRPMELENSFPPPTRLSPGRVRQSSDRPSISDSSNSCLPAIIHQDWPVSYKGIFSGSAMFDQISQCWSEYHVIIQDHYQGSQKAAVQAWTGADLQAIYPVRRIQYSDGSFIEDALPIHEQRKVSKSTYQFLGFSGFQLTELMNCQRVYAAGTFCLAAGKLYVTYSRNEECSLSGFWLENHYFVTSSHFDDDMKLSDEQKVDLERDLRDVTLRFAFVNSDDCSYKRGEATYHLRGRVHS